MAFGRRLVRLDGSGTGAELRLGATERTLLHDLVPQLRALLVEEAGDGTSGPTDPNLTRLFPTAVPDDAEDDEAFRALVHDDLLAMRLTNLDVVERTIDADVLDEEQVGVWMRTINELRLVLGTKLDVSEDDELFNPEHPDAPLQAVYGWLGLLLEQLVETASALPDPAS